MPYQSPNNIAQLLQRRGAIEGNRIVSSTDAWASGIGQIGRIAAGTLQDVAGAKEYEHDLERKRLEETHKDAVYAEAMRPVEAREATAEAIAKATNAETGVIDHEDVAKSLRDINMPDIADSYLKSQKDKAADVVNTALGNIEKVQDKIGQLNEIQHQIEKNPALYDELVARANGLLVELGSEKTMPPTYDPEQMKGVVGDLTTSHARINSVKQSLQNVVDAGKLGVAGLEMGQVQTQSLATQYMNADTQEKWDAVTQTARTLHVPEDVIGKFGEFKEGAQDNAFKIGDEAVPRLPSEKYSDAFNRYIALKNAQLSNEHAGKGGKGGTTATPEQGRAATQVAAFGPQRTGSTNQEEAFQASIAGLNLSPEETVQRHNAWYGRSDPNEKLNREGYDRYVERTTKANADNKALVAGTGTPEEKNFKPEPIKSYRDWVADFNAGPQQPSPLEAAFIKQKEALVQQYRAAAGNPDEQERIKGELQVLADQMTEAGNANQ